jgi:hypothetical protein
MEKNCQQNKIKSQTQNIEKQQIPQTQVKE